MLRKRSFVGILLFVEAKGIKNFRELCRITTVATKTFGILEGTDNRELEDTVDSSTNWLMAISENVRLKNLFYVANFNYLSKFVNNNSRKAIF